MTQAAAIDVAASADFGAFVPGARCRRAATGSGVLDGLSFAVKDLIDVEGEKTGAGNPVWLSQQKPAVRSAPVVDKALAAGAKLAGKTVTDELAFSLEGRNVHYGCPVNPSCPDRLSGGSSSGSGVAVAAGLVDFALGTDTGGSVRVPANFLGVFGFRPSHGAIPLDGVTPFAPSYDTVGWFARDAVTLERVGCALLPPQDFVPITRLLLAEDAFALVDEGLAATLRDNAWHPAATVSVFAGEDARYFDCYRILQGAEIWQSLGGWIGGTEPRFAADIAERFAGAATITPAEVAQYRAYRVMLRQRLAALLPPGTALIMPVTPCIALSKSATGAAIGDFYGRALRLTSVAGHCGAPQIAIPLGLWQDCPMGLSLLAAPASDRALLAFAALLTAATTSAATP